MLFATALVIGEPILLCQFFLVAKNITSGGCACNANNTENLCDTVKTGWFLFIQSSDFSRLFYDALFFSYSVIRKSQGPKEPSFEKNLSYSVWCVTSGFIFLPR